MPRKIPRYVRPMVPKAQQVGARHSALAELELARQTSALAMRCGQNSHHMVFTSQNVAPTATITAAGGAFVSFNVGTGSGQTAFEFPFQESSGFNWIYVACMFVTNYKKQLTMRVATSGIPSGAGRTSHAGNVSSAWSTLTDTTWGVLDPGGYGLYSESPGATEVLLDGVPSQTNLVIEPQIAIPAQSDPIITRTGNVTVYLKSMFVYEIPEEEDM